MKRLISLVVAAAVAGVASAVAQMPSTPPAAAGSYETLLTKLKGGNTKVDYRALRLAYSETKDASAAGSDHNVRRAMNEALINKRYADVFKIADEILKTIYLSPDTHAALSAAYRETGEAQKAEFHKAVYLGLINAVLATGDGTTPETAYTVVTIEEEYAVMRALSFSVWGQVMGTQAGHTFDVLSGTNQNTNETVRMYFNIDIPSAAVARTSRPN